MEVGSDTDEDSPQYSEDCNKKILGRVITKEEKAQEKDRVDNEDLEETACWEAVMVLDVMRSMWLFDVNG